jgi:hypothetical protein
MGVIEAHGRASTLELVKCPLAENGRGRNGNPVSQVLWAEHQTDARSSEAAGDVSSLPATVPSDRSKRRSSNLAVPLE